MKKRYLLSAIALAASTLLMPCVASAQDFPPKRPVTLFVGFAPGGAADAAARIVIKNTLFSPFGFGRYKLSNLVMPWVTYTDPEIAHVGMDETQAQARGLATNTIKIPLSIVDRAIADGETAGFLKIIHKQGSDQILGATIVAAHAGEMISEITTAMVAKIGLSKLSTVIHPYPTQAEAIKKAADAYRRTLLTPNSKKLLELLTKLSG